MTFVLAALLALGVYTVTLAPTVTLEYSGSLITAARHLGVANPPGYPVWTLLAWLFQKLFGFVSFRGHPNPAWGVNFMSAFFGSLSCGMIAWLVSRFCRATLRTSNTTGLVCGLASAMLYGFCPITWSQSVIAEVNTLHVFFFLAILVALHLWIEDRRDGRLRLLFFLLGLGLLTSYAFLLFFPVIVVALLGRDPGVFIRPRILLGMLVSLALGLAPMIYLPIAAAQNSPINWGHAVDWPGFLHLVTRGQYERMVPINPFTQTPMLIAQTSRYGVVLAGQMGLPAVALAMLSLSALTRRGSGRTWITILLLALFLYSVVLTACLNPLLDNQTIFIARVVWMPSYAVLAVLAGCGMGVLASALAKHSAQQILIPALLAGYLLMAVAVAARNAVDPEMVRLFGGSEQKGHAFGWQFGHWQLDGSRGIREDLEPGDEPLPNPDYPPPMEPRAIFLGGTDPGRFVNTYMIYCANVRPDIHLLTQNALADITYTSVMRGLYGDTIWIPTQQDSNFAFQQYVEDVQAGRIPAGAAIRTADGRVSVQGVAGVMIINGILARMIFEQNKYRHEFYVEESYVIPWMYPYLTPHGLILKLNPEPAPDLSSDLVKKDREFWAWLTRRLLNDPKFLRDVVARRIEAARKADARRAEPEEDLSKP